MGGVSWPGEERKIEVREDGPRSGPARPGSHGTGGAGGNPYFGSCQEKSLITKPHWVGPGAVTGRLASWLADSFSLGQRGRK